MIHFFLEGRFAGSSTTPPIRVGRDWGRPMSLLVYCGHCGEVWARVAVDGSSWTSHITTCRKCAAKAHFSETPGSLFSASWLTEAFPDAVLWWELQRHLDWFESQAGESDGTEEH